MSERDAVIRESSILLTTASADKRLASAFLAIEDLTKKSELEKLNHKKEVKEFGRFLFGLVILFIDNYQRIS